MYACSYSPECYYRAISEMGLWLVMVEFELKRLAITCVLKVVGLVTVKSRD